MRNWYFEKLIFYIFLKFNNFFKKHGKVLLFFVKIDEFWAI